MTIIRRRHNRNYTVLGNEVFSDERLSLEAMGLLCYLRSRPNDWNIAQEQLRRRFGCGHEKMQRLVRELIESGWVLRQEAPRRPGGTFGGFEYVVLDEPESGASTEGKLPLDAPAPQSGFPTVAPESGKPESVHPESAEPESAEPESANPTPYQVMNLPKGFSPLNPPVAGGTCTSDDRISEREALVGRRPERPASRRSLGRQADRGYGPAAQAADGETRARFERLWSAYPTSGRLPANRTESLARFAALSAAEQEAAIRAAGVEAKIRDERRSQARALHRWLRDGRWRNGAVVPLPGAVGAAAPVGDTRVFVLEGSPEWRAWEAHYRALGRPMPSPTQLAAGDGWRFPSALPPKVEAA